MKKSILQLSLFAIVFLCVLSCKDDPTPPSLVGTWTETSSVASGCDDPSDNESVTCTTGCEVIVISATTITSDGDSQSYTKTATTISVTDGPISYTVAYTVTETTLVITQEGSALTDGCKYVTTYKRS